MTTSFVMMTSFMLRVNYDDVYVKGELWRRRLCVVWTVTTLFMFRVNCDNVVSVWYRTESGLQKAIDDIKYNVSQLNNYANAFRVNISSVYVCVSV